MGYFVYITKATQPLYSKDSPITETEWKKAVAVDSDLAFESKSRSVVICLDEFGDEVGRMILQNGRVIAKNPNEVLLKKMKLLATSMNARVIGDDETEF